MTIQQEIFEDRILRPVGEAAQQNGIPGHGVVGFQASEGCRYNKRLMVVGRALNGGNHEINPVELADPKTREKYAQRILRDSRPLNHYCPMEWVTDRWTSGRHRSPYRSPFWKVIRDVTRELAVCDPGCRNWASYLVWSNLYKVSWASRGSANPRGPLRTVQRAGCRELLLREVQDHGPRYLLLLTGNWADPFLRSDPAWDTDSPGGPAPGSSNVCCTARSLLPGLSDTRVVVAEHPQTRPQQEWVKEVVDAFNAM